MLDLTILEASDFSIRTLAKGTHFPIIPNKKNIKVKSASRSPKKVKHNTRVVVN